FRTVAGAADGAEVRRSGVDAYDRSLTAVLNTSDRIHCSPLSSLPQTATSETAQTPNRGVRCVDSVNRMKRAVTLRSSISMAPRRIWPGSGTLERRQQDRNHQCNDGDDH